MVYKNIVEKESKELFVICLVFVGGRVGSPPEKLVLPLPHLDNKYIDCGVFRLGAFVRRLGCAENERFRKWVLLEALFLR